MKKYIPLDFDEKGNVILGRERNTPTSNGFIPTTWVPGGGGSGDEGSGLKSISISPVFSTTPALDSLFPIYYEDLTDEQKQDGVNVTLITDAPLPDSVTITVTPTPDLYAEDSETAGTPATITVDKEDGEIWCTLTCSNGELPISPDFVGVFVNLQIQYGGGQ